MQTRSLKSEQRSRAGAGVTVTLLLALALLKIDAAAGRPDVRQSPFSLELQPPLLEAAAEDAFQAGGDRTIDSYGNPIDALRPIDTPDGRKVVSAQGLQFEIPTYASGITEIRKPADDLLPPHIAPAKTSTTPAAPVEPNPFNSATLPPWLQDFDYPDVGPGVPYNPDNFKETPAAASGQKPGATKPNDFQPQGFAGSHIRSQLTEPTTTTTTSTTSAPADTDSSAFPSKVTLPLPAISSSSHSSSHNPGGPESNTVEPPLVLIPPVANSDEPSPFSSSSGSGSGSGSDSSSQPPPASALNPTTNSYPHFTARFDSPASGQETQSSTPTAAPQGTAAAEEQFPPFNGNAADSPKVEYTKSDEGKVISTPVNTLRKDAQDNNVFQASTAASPAAAASNTGKYTGGFGAPAGLLRPQSAARPDIYVAGNEHEFSTNVKANKVRPGDVPNANGGRYTGGFGAPSGVLSPQNAPRPFQQTQQPQPQPQPQPQAQPQQQPQLQPQQTQLSSSQPQQVGAAASHHQNRFGGPPGVLVPFDNVQRTGGQ
ncbi:uncharacterized protein flap isoform X7 [Drosophila montana]|uniref:uncharacterized protein flap isoform X7 n=1 Tax=Drosophila montana TaxID=40370 RepID=UPI00313E1841